MSLKVHYISPGDKVAQRKFIEVLKMCHCLSLLFGCQEISNYSEKSNYSIQIILLKSFSFILGKSHANNVLKK